MKLVLQRGEEPMSVAHRSFGPYELQEELGGGGTGIVLRCVRRDNGEAAALKIPIGDSPSLRETLRREVGVLSRLTRASVRGVVRLVDHGIERGVPWYAMELLQGHSLAFWQRQIWSRAQESGSPPTHSVTPTVPVTPTGEPEPDHRETQARCSERTLRLGKVGASRPPAAAGQLERVLNVLFRLSEVLGRLHAEGVVHGDVTPQNIVLRDETDPVLIDFGAALTSSLEAAPHEVPAALSAVRGTPGYMAPEVLASEPIDARADLYALGCIVYELITGTRPFGVPRTRAGLDARFQRVAAPSDLVSGVSERLEDLVMGLLAPEPACRIAHAEDVCDALREHLSEPPKVSRHRRFKEILYRPRLRGRADVYRRLAGAVDAAREGCGELVVVGGPSGIGKTRLMNELAGHAARAGTRVIWCRGARFAAMQADGHGLPSGGLELFRPVVDAVAEMGKAAEPTSANGRPYETLQGLPQLVPGLAASASGAGEMPAWSPAEATRRAFNGLKDLMQRLAAPAGLVLLVDDLQWSDELSRLFLKRCAGELTRSRVLIVANYRYDAAGAAVDDLADVAAVRLELGSLDLGRVREMAQDLLGTESLPEGLAEFLSHESEGNPLYVTEYARAALSMGALQRQRGGWSFNAERARLLDVPKSIEGLLRFRLQPLSRHARAALRQACVLFGDFEADSFQTLVSGNVEPTEVLEELVAREVLVPVGGRYRFVHDKLREGQERSLTAAQRRRCHLRIARHLERNALQRDDVAAVLGYHWACAGQARRALQYLEPAAAGASAAYSLERAAELYRLAIAQCKLLGGTAASRMPALREALGDILVKQAKHEEARLCFRHLQRELPRDAGLARARAYRKLAASFWTMHEYGPASSALDHAEQDLVLGCDSTGAEFWTELIQVRLGRFEQWYFSGRTGPMLHELVNSLSPLIDRHGNEDQSCVYYFTAASYKMLEHRYAFDPDVVLLARKGLAAAHSLPPHRRALGHFILGYALMLGSREQCRQSLVEFELARTVAEQTHEATLLSRVYTYRAIALLRLGDVERTEQAAEVAHDAAQAARLKPYSAAAQTCLGWVAWKRDDPTSAARLLRAARDAWHAHPHAFPFQNLALFPLIDAAQAKDDFDAARALLIELRTGLPALQPDLAAAVSSALEAIGQASAREASRAIAQVVATARACAMA